jgi:hypothetical protein
MNHRFSRWQLAVGLAVLALAVGSLLSMSFRGFLIEEVLAGGQKPLAEPPKGQKYTGAKACSACHFDQYLDWRQTKHAKAFDALPARYQNDESCLKCHTTGFGEETGFKNVATTSALVGASCESCHGPGSKHAEIAKSFGDKKLSQDEEAYVRSTIWKMQPKNVCVTCHLTRAHQKHPDYVK